MISYIRTLEKNEDTQEMSEPGNTSPSNLKHRTSQTQIVHVRAILYILHASLI